MTVLVPGTVAGYVPYRILPAATFSAPHEWLWHQYLGSFVIAIGVAILLRCIWAFAHHGSGTLAPFDEPRQLVVQGLYQYMRNPMYVGVLLILIGESWVFWSWYLLLYTSLFFGVINVLVMAYEEQRLRAKFGIEYEQYCQAVDRWLPGKSSRNTYAINQKHNQKGQT